MSDDEFDREWEANKPAGRARPQSTMARSFSASLNELFKIDNSLADLDAAVDQKKKALSSQTSELEALEARLKATEERLRQRQMMSSGSPRSSHQRSPLGDTFAAVGEPKANPGSPLTMEFRPKTPTPPASARKDVQYSTAPPMPGALPPTPGASEGEYDDGADDEDRISADYVVVGKDGDSQPPR